MKEKLLITNGQLVLPDRILPCGHLLTQNGIIERVSKHSDIRGIENARIIDAQGGYVLPGFIDIHSDAIEKEIEPRPGAFIEPTLAFTELEKKLAGQGITTMYHSFSFAGAESGLREDNNAAWIIRRIVATSRARSVIRNKIHARFEITDYLGVEILENLIEDRMIDLLSFMDHTPGQGQYQTFDDYRNYMAKTYHLPDDRIEMLLEGKELGRSKSGQSIAALREKALSAKVPMASHDDDSPDKVAFYQGNQVTIHEFPVNIETARAASGQGHYVCVGAPNIIRGGSSGKAMRAMDAITDGCADIICSDYYPGSLLHSVFEMTSKMTLPEAARMVTLHPALATGQTGLGSLEEGKWADVVVVNFKGGIPVVTHTIVNGFVVYELYYREPEQEQESNEQSA
jgi:alpha-D-ribose 1-methylphosphonate 5-triphosphate diphosphatase